MTPIKLVTASGLLLSDGRYHCAPVPVVFHNGRVWRAMEAAMGGGWGQEFRVFMMSAPEDADLLQATNWTCSNRIGGNGSWLNGQFGGWLEDNAVPAPDGKMVDILRVDCRSLPERAAVIQISDDGRQASF